MFEKEKNEEIPKLDSEKAYEILMNVFRESNVEPPVDCHKYFEKKSASKEKKNAKGKFETRTQTGICFHKENVVENKM